MKKLLSFSLALIVLMSVAVIPAFAENADTGMHVSAGDFEFEYLGNSQYSLVQYHGNDAEVTVPDTLEGSQVVRIDSGAFKNNISITKVIVPEGISEIGDSAFAHCRRLSSVTIPQSLTTIGDKAFLDCKNMRSITLPDSVTTIGDMSLGFCRKGLDLESVTYTYRVDFDFAIYASEGSAAAEYATTNGTKLNEFGEYDPWMFTLQFIVPEQWADAEKIYCHITELGENARTFTAFQSKKEECTMSEITGQNKRLATYRVEKMGGIDEGTVYSVVMSAEGYNTTYPAILTARCESYRLYTDDTYVITPEDTSPRLYARWQKYQNSEDVDFSDYEEAFGIYRNAEFITIDSAKDESTYDEKPPINALPYGDADTDGVITIKDATAIQKHLAELETLSETGFILADFLIHSGYDLSISNATYIQKYCAGLESMEKVGTPAYTTLLIERPREWSDNLVIHITSWNDEASSDEDKYHTWAATQEPDCYTIMECYIPVYNPYLIIYTEESSSNVVTLNLPEDNSDNNVYNAVAESWTGYDENGRLTFVLVDHA
ncbi:MAG: leucine-rich repeat protein [Ruminococcus sp.]|nr:leucine-rich repeat protein [Ruminococcus sp.]